MATEATPPEMPMGIPADLDEKQIEQALWPKIKRVAVKVPGVSDVLALYFYLNSELAPLQHKVSILATLAYFIIPTDMLPDFFGAMGYTDDIAIAMGLIKFIGAETMKPYRDYARKWLRGEAKAEDMGGAPQ